MDNRTQAERDYDLTALSRPRDPMTSIFEWAEADEAIEILEAIDGGEDEQKIAEWIEIERRAYERGLKAGAKAALENILAHLRDTEPAA